MNNKVEVKIVVIGHLKRRIDISKLRSFKSEIFSIEEPEYIDYLPIPQKNDGYLNIVYSKDEIINLLKSVKSSGIVVGIINYPFDDNFYMHRVGLNKTCISISDIDYILLENQISIENFILKNIYEVCVLKQIFGDDLTDEIYDFVHLDTRGCLFDMNGDKRDIVYNTEQPIVCDECKSKISSISVPNGYLKLIERELSKIRKSRIKSIELFIKKYPLASVLFTLIFSIIINILSNCIWECFK